MLNLLAALSIRARLWLLFCGALSALVLSSGTALVNMAGAHRATSRSLELADRLTTAVDTARGTQVQFRKQVKEWKDLLLRGTEPGMFEKYQSGFDAAEAEVASGFTRMRASLPELGIDRAHIDAAEVATQNLGKKARVAIASFDRARPESAFAVDRQARGLDSVGSAAIDGLVHEITARKDVLTQELHASAEASLAAATRATWVSGLLIALLLAAGSILTIASVTGPLLRTISVFDSIRGGNLSTEVPLDRRHEFGALWASLDAMQATLRKDTEELKSMNEQLVRSLAEIAALNDKAERLLLNILPASIAARLKEKHQVIAEAYPEVTILFADMVGFTSFSQTVSPTELVNVLNQIFSRFDALVEQLGLEKIKTIGDCYMACGGLPVPRPDHARVVAEMAMAMHREMEQVSATYGKKLQMRIGINTGPVVAGVIGAKKFIYDLWGDAVNTASRMESHGAPGGIHLSESTWRHLAADYEFADRGEVTVKGKGPMRTFFLLGQKGARDPKLLAAAHGATAAH
jgi:class 3 adenylate cyclase